MKENKVLRSTELTGVIGRNEMERLSGVVGVEKWSEYRKLYDEASQLKIHDYPVQLDIELNASCNLRCPMCPISAESPKGKGKSTWFSFDLYKEIILDGVKNGLKAIKLNYINEPLIRDDIVKFIDFARKNGIVDVYMSTNGVLMDRKICKSLIDSGLSRLQISIDATNQKTYDILRPGGDFNKVLENIDTLLLERKLANSITPLVRVNFVRTELNEHQVDEFISIWKDKVDMIGIQEFIKPTTSSAEIKSKTSVKKSNFKFQCSFPFKQMVVNNECKVLPCCTFWGEELSVGKLNKASDLKKIWNGEKMQWLRKMHLDGRYNEIKQCNQCVNGGVDN